MRKKDFKVSVTVGLPLSVLDKLDTFLEKNNIASRSDFLCKIICKEMDKLNG